METKQENHAEQNAKAWAETIVSLVAAVECDYDRLNELREMDAADMSDDEKGELEDLEAFGQVDGDKMESADDVRERIQESALDIQVRDGWYTPGERDGNEPEEFQILLTTGGPALRIMGELDEHKQPSRAWLQYQDWGTPWTDYLPGHGFGDVLLTFCQQFYFGE